MIDISRFYFPGERKRIRRAVMKALLWSISISFLLFTAFGYGWHYWAVTERHEKQISMLMEKIENYRENWTPMREKEKEISKKEVGRK
jgi:hypothetical protein